MAQELKLRHKYVMVRSHRRSHFMAHRTQVPVEEDMVEHVGATPPRYIFRLYGPITGFGKLSNQRVVVADVEIAADQRRAVRAAQQFRDESPLLGMMLT